MKELDLLGFFSSFVFVFLLFSVKYLLEHSLVLGRRQEVAKSMLCKSGQDVSCRRYIRFISFEIILFHVLLDFE